MGKKRTHFIIISRVSNVTGGAITLNFLLLLSLLAFSLPLPLPFSHSILPGIFHSHFGYPVAAFTQFVLCTYTLFFIFINFCQQWNILQIFININQFLCVEIEFMTFWVLNWVIPRSQPLPLIFFFFSFFQ